MPVVPAPRKLRHKDHEFKSSPGYIVRRCLKKPKKTKTKKPKQTKKLAWAGIVAQW
jgi:hypothetical protein